MTDRDRLIRERLIELIRNSNCVSTWDYHLDDFKDPNPVLKLADYLLANGVFILPEDLRGTEDFSISAFIEAMQMYKDKVRYIKPPCKVGQTVYYIAGKKVYKSKCHAITQHKNGLQIHLYDYDGDNARYSTKDVFLTKEEAQKALAERKDNNG